MAFGTFEPESALLALLAVRLPKDSLGISMLDRYVVRSIDGGRTWSKSLEPVKTVGNNAVNISDSSHGNIVSSGVGTASVVLANHYDCVNSNRDEGILFYDHIRYCTDDAGLSWADCGFTTQRAEPRYTDAPLYDGMPYPQLGSPFVSGIYNTGEGLIAFRNIHERRSIGDRYAKIYTGVAEGSLSDTCPNGAPQGIGCYGRIFGLTHSHQEITLFADDSSNRVDRNDPIAIRVYSSRDKGLSWQSTLSDVSSVSFRASVASFFPLKCENVYDADLIVTAQGTVSSSFYPASKRVNFSPVDEANTFSIDIAQFTDHDASVLLCLANLGNGRLVMS